MRVSISEREIRVDSRDSWSYKTIFIRTNSFNSWSGITFFPQPEKNNNDMSQQELTSYRLSSLQEPTDDMLHAIMEQVAESARRSTAKFQAELHRRFEQIRLSGKS